MNKFKRNEKILKEMLLKKWMVFDPKKEMQERAWEINSRLETAKRWWWYFSHVGKIYK